MVQGTIRINTNTPTTGTPSASTMAICAGRQPRLVDPSRIPGLVGWYMADKGVFKDAAMTQPVQNNGDTVLGWFDYSMTGNHLKTGNGGTWLTNQKNKLPGLQMLNASSQYLATTSNYAINLPWSFVVAFFVGPDTSYEGALICSAQPTNAGYPVLRQYNFDIHNVAFGYNLIAGGGASSWGGLGTNAQNSFQTYFFNLTTVEQDWYSDSLVGQPGLSFATTPNILMPLVGWSINRDLFQTPPQGYGNNIYYEIMVFNRSLSVADITTLNFYLKSKWTVP